MNKQPVTNIGISPHQYYYTRAKEVAVQKAVNTVLNKINQVINRISPCRRSQYIQQTIKEIREEYNK